MCFHKKQSGQLVNLHESLRFLDSYQFVSQSSENLAETSKAKNFSILKQFFSNTPGQLFVKLIQKGFFHAALSTVLKNSKNRFPLMVTLLTGAIDFTPSDYQHALNIYQMFGCRNLGDYHNIYLITDVFRPAEMFEKFRNVRLKV